MAQMTISVIVGNPKPQSRTSQIALEVSRQLTDVLEKEDVTVAVQTTEVAELGPYLFGWENAKVQEAIEQSIYADLIIVASPTYKATYTGLLKSFLDLFPPGGLQGKVAIPVMVGAAPHHSLAVEVFLRPLLIELGASCPAKGIYFLDSQMENLSEIVSKWLEQVKLPFIQALRMSEHD